ncbi:MAG: histidine--tRNA ligase [Bacillota bacterium]|nr:MAG: histidine--tRNA ligase [Bacillota bacterium]
MINIPKGTKDVLPKESFKWRFIEETARKTAADFNVKEIRTPVFEHTEVFARGVGDTTDIVNKEMYTFNDKGNRSITLKPEGTSAVVRSFIENGLFNETLPSKLFYITPCFRYERPQAGRLREFHQFGVEIFGGEGADTDAEVILLAKTFLERVGIRELSLNLNSIGCKTCRAEYNAALREYLKSRESELCPLCRERAEKNPLRVLDCKDENCKKVTANAPRILDYLCEDCKTHFEKVKSLLTACGVEYTVDPDIVRGLDYYTKTVFEFVSTAIGAQGTVCGGGRYDGLVESMGGPALCGAGFGLGLERLLLLMENLNVSVPDAPAAEVYIAPMGERAYEQAFKIVYGLRKKGVSAETDHAGRSLKAQMKYADKIGAKHVIVLGDSELDCGEAEIKRMSDGEKRKVSLRRIEEEF